MTLDGRNIYENPELKEKLVFVPDELYFLPQANMLRMAQTYASFYPRFDRSRFGELTDASKLNPKANLGTFSRACAARSRRCWRWPARPTSFFLDETFDGLDPIMRNLVKKFYADVAERGATAVITSHSLRELEDTCDQLALLHKGGIVFESDVQNLKTTLFKVQIAFDHDYDHTLFSGFDVLNFTKHGSVSNPDRARRPGQGGAGSAHQEPDSNGSAASFARGGLPL